MLPAIDVEKLRPSPDSLKQLKDEILDDARGEEWLRAKVRSLDLRGRLTYSDGALGLPSRISCRDPCCFVGGAVIRSQRGYRNQRGRPGARVHG